MSILLHGDLQTEPQACLSKPSLPALLGKVEESEDGDVNATGVMLVCGNKSMLLRHRESGKAPCQRNAL